MQLGRIAKFTLIVINFSTIIRLCYALPETTLSTQTHLKKQEQQFIQHMVKQYNFNKKKLTELLEKAQYLPIIIASMKKPLEKKPWNFYRNYFLQKRFIDSGVTYWKTHQKILQQVEEIYGVDPSIIVAIIGIESFYGTHVGDYQTISTLSTLAFHYSPREFFFQKELAKYLLLTRQYHLSPLKLKGSYAGALGIPQFMPSSYLRYAVKFTKINYIDLFHNHADAIASIANYLRTEGWKSGQLIAIPIITSKHIPQQLISMQVKPNQSIATFPQYAICPIQKFITPQKATLIDLKSGNLDEYWLTFTNFRAIMNYNQSPLYAMAVYQLSQAIRKEYERNTY